MPVKTIVNKRHQKYDVYIGRGSIWGNPFVIGKDGTREEVIEKYREYAATNKVIIDNLPKLDGKILGCFCAPLPCHGDVLAEMLENLEKELSTLE